MTISMFGKSLNLNVFFMSDPTVMVSLKPGYWKRGKGLKKKVFSRGVYIKEVVRSPHVPSLLSLNNLATAIL